MIIQFSVENFKSIYEQAIFSMVASKDTTHTQYLRDRLGLKILPSTIIVGANGAGKSNLFQALKYLQRLLSERFETVFPFYPHKIGESNITKIDLQFIMDGKRYAYGIGVSVDRVRSEYLVQVINNQEVLVFERVDEELTYQESSFKINPLTFGINYLKELGIDSSIQSIQRFITEHIIVVLAEGTDEQALFNKMCEEFKQNKTQVLVSKFIKKLDIGIKDFKSEHGKIEVVYENMRIDLQEESTGTKRLFMFLTLISDVVNEGKVFVIDELEKNLHLMLATTIINLFNHQSTNPSFAQLIFSTHNTSLLNLSLFRRDQVWLVEKDMDTLNTVIYSLYNILDVLEDENIEFGYVKGKYGATFKIDFSEVVSHDE